MSICKTLCFSLFMSVFLSSNISMAQENESAEALLEKANQYDIQRDYQQAMVWYLKAANKGSASAMNSIGF